MNFISYLRLQTQRQVGIRGRLRQSNVAKGSLPVPKSQIPWERLGKDEDGEEEQKATRGGSKSSECNVLSNLDLLMFSQALPYEKPTTTA